MRGLLFSVSLTLALLPTSFGRKCREIFCHSQQELFGWVERNGGYIHPDLELSTGDDPSWKIRGIFAVADIPREELLMKVPKHVLLCSDVIDVDNTGASMCNLIDKLANEMGKAEESFYYPYISSMADHDVNIPAVWTKKELELLSGLHPSDWTRHVTWFRNNCRGDVKDPVAFRAMLLVVARSNGFQSKSCLSPIYDSLNHGNYDVHNTRIASEGDSLVVISTTEIKAGAQVFNHFGEENVGRLLRDYGFISQFPRLWEFVGSQNQVYQFWENRDAETGEIDIRMNPEYWSEENASNMLEEVQRHLYDLLYNKPAILKNPTELNAMSQDRVTMAKDFRNVYLDAFNRVEAALQAHIESQSQSKSEL